MNHDNRFRRFRFVQADDSTDFLKLTSGWLELAEARAPGAPKALLEGDFLARLPDGSCFKEISYKREHEAVEQALPDWSQSEGRTVARVDNGNFVLTDGRQFPLDQIRFPRVK
jgi:hypothetical protein